MLRRLDQATFNRVKAAGYTWAPKQECFVAPMWTPGRADIALFMSVLFSLRLGGPSLAPFDGLSRWFERLKLRPAFTQAAVEIAEADRRLSFPLKRA